MAWPFSEINSSLKPFPRRRVSMLFGDDGLHGASCTTGAGRDPGVAAHGHGGAAWVE